MKYRCEIVAIKSLESAVTSKEFNTQERNFNRTCFWWCQRVPFESILKLRP